MLLQASTEGHTYLPEEELTRRTGQLLEVGEEQIEKQYMDLAIERKIIMKQGENQTQIYAASFYYMEANTATMLKQLNVSYEVPDLEIEERVRRIEKQTGMELDEHQMTAVKEAVRNGLSPEDRVPEKRRRSIRSSSILRWKDLIFFSRRPPDVRRSA